MAENEVRIRVTTETDIAPLEEMDDTLEDIQDKTDVAVNVDTGDIEDATDKTEELTDDLEEADDTTVSPDTDTSGFDELIDVAEEIRDKLDEISNTTVAPEVDTSGLEKANEDLEETESSIGSLKTAIVGLVATAEIEHMATVADNVNNSWNRLKLTFEGTNVTMDVLKERVTEVSSETSRGAGIIREYFNQMGIAGVTNVDLLSSSFESLSGKAYQTNSSIEEMESKMQTMVLTGNASSKMLKALGLSAEDLARSIGVSVDELSEAFSQLSPEQRLQAITNAMGDGATANAMYGDSYEAMKTKAENAMSGLEGAVGQAILPSVIPALDAGTQAVKGLTQGFKNLPEPVQGAIGTVLGVGAIATTGIGMFGEFAGAIANLSDAYGVLKDVYKALIPVEYAEGTAGWFSIGWIAAAILLGIALGLAFIYLYENCDWFREAVDNLAATLQWLAGVISDSVMGTIQWLSEEFQNFTNQLGLNTEDWTQAILGFILFIPQLPMYLGQILLDAIAQALGFGDNFTQSMITSATNGVNGFISAVLGFPGWLWSILVAAYNRVVQFGNNFVTNLVNRALNAVNGFSNAVQGIPRALQSCLDWAYNLVMSHPLVQALVWLGQQAANAFAVIGLGQRSPGKIVKALRNELNWASDAVYDSDLAKDAATLGDMLSDSFNPNLSGVEFGNARLVNGSNPSNPGSVVNLTLNVGNVDKQERVDEIIEAVRNYFYWDNTTAGRTN